MVALATTAGCSAGGQDAAVLSGVVRSPAVDVSAVVLPDVTATTATASFTMGARRGGFLLVYFGYTQCVDECPLTLGYLDRAVRALPSDRRARVTVAFVTVDPKRDTPGVLRDFVAHFATSIRVLRTTDAARLRAALAAFRASAAPAREVGGTIDHSALTAVVDDAGRMVLEWPFGTESAAMTHDLEILFDRESQ